MFSKRIRQMEEEGKVDVKISFKGLEDAGFFRGDDETICEDDEATWEDDEAAWEDNEAAWEDDEVAWEDDEATWDDVNNPLVYIFKDADITCVDAANAWDDTDRGSADVAKA